MNTRKLVVVTVAAAFVAGLCLAGGAAAQERTYVSNAQCKMCHNKPAEGEQWNKWKAEKHAKALETLKTDEAKKLASAKGIQTPPDQAPECLRCHVTGYDVAKKAAPPTIKMEDGVQCESCHGPNSLHAADAKKHLTDKKIDRALLVKPEEATCLKCHNSESVSWKEDRYTTADGKKVGFDFKQAYEKIKHLNPAKAAAK